MRFLVVDDSAVDRHLLTNLLQELGHQTDVFTNTQGLIEKIAAEKYDSVFLDVVMPEQDGYKFLRTLRSNPSTAQQHVILYSSKKTALEINYGLKRAGANEYLVKPANQETLTQIINKI
ncbi:MAG: response regulator [Gomphosphaeria aponina SAG 52.96 = DSM 107014]|uniref:Response regulator n=1 Tax=Gomphosphaeria aponina SAG 52.96 = DSM 107014 TaxID=1521640 RepID=A0A941GXT5_9CHRO|nr:response regulator [Gomphosphaeria aponina SAG 52.96 = DSM 107014]